VRVWWGLIALTAAGCGRPAPRATVFYASGADLQSINPLLTVHPLARQVQRYALFTTLARYDSQLVARPYLAESWRFSADGRALDVRLRSDVRWHDGVPTTAADVVFTLEAARDPATGYPRRADLACLTDVRATGALALRLAFCRPQAAFPDVLTDLAVLPAHLLDSLPHGRLRQAAFNEHPVGNGPFRFVAHVPNQRWVFEADRGFPPALGGPPAIRRLVIVVVDEPATASWTWRGSCRCTPRWCGATRAWPSRTIPSC